MTDGWTTDVVRSEKQTSEQRKFFFKKKSKGKLKKQKIKKRERRAVFIFSGEKKSNEVWERQIDAREREKQPQQSITSWF